MVSRVKHEIAVEKEEGNFFYLSSPKGIRVNKSTMAIEKNIGGLYVPVHEFINCGYPAFYADNKVWIRARIIATLFIPNPDGLPLLFYVDDNPKNTDPSNLKWSKSPKKLVEKAVMTDASAREEALDGFKSRSKEYFDAYNKIEGKDGLTNSERFRKRYIDMGYVKVKKEHSPTGRSFFCPPVLAMEIREAFYEGKLEDQAVKDSFIERIKKEVSRKNNWYKD